MSHSLLSLLSFCHAIVQSATITTNEQGSRGSYPESPRRPPSAKQPEKKVKSRAATPKKDTAEGLDPFQKQVRFKTSEMSICADNWTKFIFLDRT